MEANDQPKRKRLKKTADSGDSADSRDEQVETKSAIQNQAQKNATTKSSKRKIIDVDEEKTQVQSEEEDTSTKTADVDDVEEIIPQKSEKLKTKSKKTEEAAKGTMSILSFFNKPSSTNTSVASKQSKPSDPKKRSAKDRSEQKKNGRDKDVSSQKIIINSKEKEKKEGMEKDQDKGKDQINVKEKTKEEKVNEKKENAMKDQSKNKEKEKEGKECKDRSNNEDNDHAEDTEDKKQKQKQTVSGEESEDEGEDLGDEDEMLVYDEEEECIEDEKQTKKKPSKDTASAIKKLSSLVSGKYDPVKDAGWKAGDQVPYLVLARLFMKISAETKRLTMTAFLTNFFRSILVLSPNQLLACVYLVCNKIAPAYAGKELGVGDHLIMKALSGSTGSTKLKDAMKKTGDLGEVAAQARAKQSTIFPLPPLTIQGVFTTFRKIADMSGKQSANKRVEAIQKMLSSAKEGIEAKFIVRALQGNLRIGLAEQTVLVSLAHACALNVPTKKSAKSSSVSSSPLEKAVKTVKQAYTELPNYDIVVKALLEHPIDELLKHVHLTPGVPVKVMLGKPTKGLAEVLAKFGKHRFTLEFKYDGERAQIHLLEDGTIKIYSRNSEDNTSKYPDLIQMFPEVVKASHTTSCILDCECVAWDVKQKKILPFQTLATRKRKDVKEEDVKVQVCLFAFDLLYRNGKSFLNETFETRRKELRTQFAEIPGKFQFAISRDTSDEEEMRSFFELAVNSSCEGLMVKTLDTDSNYIPNKRNWLKVKKDYLEGVGDTLDLVPIGAFYGKGKRTGVYGAFLLACYDDVAEQFQTVCKIGTGFSDEILEQHAKSLQEKEIKMPKHTYYANERMKPDVWFEPCQVWEVKCADLTLSPIHTAACGQLDEEKGIALRFPRFMRIRDDKKPEDATSSSQIVDMYQNQGSQSSTSKKSKRPPATSSSSSSSSSFSSSSLACASSSSLSSSSSSTSSISSSSSSSTCTSNSTS